VLAKSYVAGGASCLSVLTDSAYFGGSAGDLEEARGAVDVPVLRKDFTVSSLDVADARLMGADAVLLIVAALDDAELRDFSAVAQGLGMAALVEVHDEVDRARAERLAAAMPAGVVCVAESGIRDGADVERLREAGFDAVLVGETLVTAADPTAALQSLRGVAPCS
jgi:indole-3-glycerol phosphate synthase